jgi:TPR repeat protein
MALFGRKKQDPPPRAAAPPIAAESPAPAAVAADGPHWTDIESIRAEWPQSSLDAQADLASWRRGVELYQNDDYGSMMRCAQLLAPALAHSLHGEGILHGADLPETVHKALFAALSPPPDGQTFEEATQRVCRLALTIIRENGWQPQSMGGGGQFDNFLDGSRILLGIALSRDGFSMGGNLSEFFAVPPTPLVTAKASGQDLFEAIDRMYETVEQANAGDEASELRLRGMGLWMNGHLEEAMEPLSEAGRLGSAQAMKDAGDLAQELGREGEARFWFESAANAGHAAALYNMGVLAGNVGDFDTAAGWWQRAAEAGDATGYAALTQVAANREDGAEERKWARLGAEAGHPFCMSRHGLFLVMDNPDDVPAARQAVAYLEAAAEAGDIDAMTLVVNVHRQLGQFDKSREWATRVRATGDVAAIQMMDRYGY